MPALAQRWLPEPQLLHPSVCREADPDLVAVDDTLKALPVLDERKSKAELKCRELCGLIPHLKHFEQIGTDGHVLPGFIRFHIIEPLPNYAVLEFRIREA